MWIVIVAFAVITGLGLHDMSVQHSKLEKQTRIQQAKVKQINKKKSAKVTMLDGVEITNLELKG